MSYRKPPRGIRRTKNPQPAPAPAAWQPMRRVPVKMETIQAVRETHGDELADELAASALYVNDRYQVAVRRQRPRAPETGAGGEGPDLIHLSIKRRDRQPIHDWRDLQEIKNDILGTEVEAVELYPAESRLVDGANQYHLWAFDDAHFRWPFGFNERLVADAGEATVADVTQRAFHETEDPAAQLMNALEALLNRVLFKGSDEAKHYSADDTPWIEAAEAALEAARRGGIGR